MINADISITDAMPRTGAMKRPNALHPTLMKPSERRAELCAILGLGIVRLHLRMSHDPIWDQFGGTFLDHLGLGDKDFIDLSEQSFEMLEAAD